jgi:hypothetical protein
VKYSGLRVQGLGSSHHSYLGLIIESTIDLLQGYLDHKELPPTRTLLASCSIRLSAVTDWKRERERESGRGGEEERERGRGGEWERGRETEGKREGERGSEGRRERGR